MELDTDGMAVLHALTQACSQNSLELKPAESQLKQWETSPGFYSILLSIAFDHSNIAVNVRWLAVLYFKNGVDRYWRRNAPNAISEEEKAALKVRLASNFNEPVPQIATQFAVLIAKIARMDCPRFWPDLLPALLNAVKASDALVQERALLTLHHVIKALASKRLACDRKVFEELTSDLLVFAHDMWLIHTDSFINALHSSNARDASLWLDRAVLSLKVLRKLVVHGLKDNQSNATATNFLTAVFSRMEEFLHAKKSMLNLSKDLLPKREKFITLLTKVLLDSQEHRPEAFIPFIEPSLHLAVKYCFQQDTEGILHERFMVNVLNLMRSILRCSCYRPAKNIEDTKQNPMQAHKIKMSFFTQPTLAEICRRLVLHHFPLTMEDLQCWDADPEEFMCEESGDSWKFSLRPCTESLYLTLVKEFREAVTPVIIDMVKECQGPSDPSDLHAILTKDAVYNAIGQASFDLYDDIDFDSWFRAQLLAELQIKENHYRIIRRRVIWLIGHWVGVKLSTDLRPVLYESILPLLQPSEDLVVRMEAAGTLKVAVDDFEFQQQQFLPYLPEQFGALFRLLQDVQECESKMQILHVMSFLVERMTLHIRPHAAILVQYLPSLWQESEDHNMLRCAILTTLTNLVQGLGAESSSIQSFLVPLIRVSTDVSQPPHVYLCEDGLTLWQTVLQCSPVATPDLLSLYSNMPQLLELGGDTLRTCIKIIEAYLYLNAKEFLHAYAHSLVTSLLNLMSDIKSEGVVLIYKIAELVFRFLPEDGPRLFQQMLPDVLKSVLEKDEYPMVAALQMSLLSRLILHSPIYFEEFFNRSAQQVNRSSVQLLCAYIDACVEKLDNVIQPERKKLIALAFASLLTKNQSVVQERFGAIMSVCVEVLHDVSKATVAEGPFIDYLVLGDADAQSVDEMDSEHEKRKREASLTDPVHQMSLKDFILERLHVIQQQNSSQMETLFSQVDIDVYTQLQHFLK